MRTTGIVAVLGTMLLAAPAAGGVPVPSPDACCACLLPVATEPGQDGRPALACAAVSSKSEFAEFVMQCQDQGNSPLCVKVPFATALQDPQDTFCDGFLLQQEGIVCPVRGEAAPVPAVGAGALAGLALALGGLGVWAARRRG